MRSHACLGPFCLFCLNTAPSARKGEGRGGGRKKNPNKPAAKRVTEWLPVSLPLSIFKGGSSHATSVHTTPVVDEGTLIMPVPLAGRTNYNDFEAALSLSLFPPFL